MRRGTRTVIMAKGFDFLVWCVALKKIENNQKNNY